MNETDNPTIVEEHRTTVVSGLTANDCVYLRKDCFGQNRSRPPYEIMRRFEDDNIAIRNTSYSGIIQLENVRVHFSTKVKTNLFYMLSFLKDESNFYYDPEMVIDIKEGNFFFDILGRLFLNELDDIFKKGFFKSYVRKQENLRFLKGKLMLCEQVRNDALKRPRFHCAFEDLTFDNLENRIILKAITLLVPLIRFNNEIKRELIRYSYLLREEVSLSNVLPSDCDRVQFSRLNEYYEPIIKFSKIVLQNFFI